MLERVSIHAPARGATIMTTQTAPAAMFQSTRPHGARHDHAVHGHARGWVSIHAPARGATRAGPPRPGSGPCFNPRARTGRDPLTTRSVGRVVPFQSTRPHGARPVDEHRSLGDQDVSIHAPARGATVLPLARRPLLLQFQSTRPHGARLAKPSDPVAPGCFNPRARTGRDECGLQSNSSLVWFQSTRPHGARHAQQAREPGPALFQSTRPHGARRRWPLQEWWPARFNPRARTGRDARSVKIGTGGSVSIHAPARGATRSSARRGWAIMVSIHAPARGATSSNPRPTGRSVCFNPRARTGRD